MKKIFFSLFILLNLHGIGQELEFLGGVNTTIFNNRNFYKKSTVFLQPGFDIGADFAFNRAKTLFMGLNVSYYRGGLQYVSDANIKHLLKRQIWLVKLPLFYKFKFNKFNLKWGLIFQYPFSDIYIYDIYDDNRLVYHNSDEPIQQPYTDYIQGLVGAEYHLSKQLKLNFQMAAFSYLVSFNHIHFSTGLIYTLNLDAKNKE